MYLSFLKFQFEYSDQSNLEPNKNFQNKSIKNQVNFNQNIIRSLKLMPQCKRKPIKVYFSFILTFHFDQIFSDRMLYQYQSNTFCWRKKKKIYKNEAKEFTLPVIFCDSYKTVSSSDLLRLNPRFFNWRNSFLGF